MLSAMPFLRRSLTHQFAAAIAMATVSVVAAVILATDFYTAAARKTMKRDLDQTIDYAKYFHAQQIGVVKQLALTLSHVPAIRDGTAGECTAALADFEQRFPQISRIALVNPEGFIYCASNPLNAPTDRRDSPFYRRAIETGEFSLGNYRLDGFSGTPILVAANPITNEAGDITNILAMGLRLSWLNGLFAQVLLPKDVVVAVVDAEGIVLAHFPPDESMVGKAFGGGELTGPLFETASGQIEVSDPSGARSFVAFASLAPAAPNERIVARFPTDKVWRDMRNAATSQPVLLIVIGFTLSLILLTANHRLVIRRIEQLSDVTSRLAAGDTSARSGLPRSLDELGRLAAGFDDLIDQLTARQQTLDATAKKSAKQKAQVTRLSEQLELILHSAGEGICGLDLDGRIVFANAAAASMVGREASALIGQSHHDLLHHSRPDGSPFPREESPILEALRAGTPYRAMNDVFWRQDWTAFPVEYSSNPVIKDGITAGAVVVFRDVSERVQFERALERKAEDLARSNAELENFAYLASHDLQEPLRKIQAFGERLKQGFSSDLDERGLDYLNRMQNASRRMSTLINDLLSYSRVAKRGKEFTPTNLNAVVEEVVSDLEVRISESDADIRMKELPSINADASQMYHVFQNLIGNALKFRRPDMTPHISIDAELARDEHTGAAGDRVWRISVADNGIGFDQKHQERIFTIFERLHGRGSYEGTGVGLAIVRRIVERHGGSIRAVGNPEHGARFEILLPETH